jgi:hypothetical protein
MHQLAGPQLIAGVAALAQHAARQWPLLQSLTLSKNKLGGCRCDNRCTTGGLQVAQLHSQGVDLCSNLLTKAETAVLKQCLAQEWPQVARSLFL